MNPPEIKEYVASAFGFSVIFTKAEDIQWFIDALVTIDGAVLIEKAPLREWIDETKKSVA